VAIRAQRPYAELPDRPLDVEPPLEEVDALDRSDEPEPLLPGLRATLPLEPDADAPPVLPPDASPPLPGLPPPADEPLDSPSPESDPDDALAPSVAGSFFFALLERRSTFAQPVPLNTIAGGAKALRIVAPHTGHERGDSSWTP
jgi:hypothetical protein